MIPVSVYAQLQAQIDKNGKTIQKVPLESIKLDENIRESYDEQGLKVLAESMQRDGLIQFPTLCLKATPSGEFSLVCKNGHRRILAAKLLGWQLIESVILPFASARDELYHTIAANLREDVFYLDLAQAYQQAHHLGESDTSIAERVGVNVRTVGWYRRLTKLPSECQVLCRQYPDLFNATWAIKLARKEKQAKDSLKSIFSGAHGPQEAQMAWRIVEQLCTAGYFKASLLQKLRRQLVPSAPKASRAQGATVAG
ncbi:MAG: ParB N-terminal domain-containing protein [Proteobacteria bacterium]|nr:ParB N-terminal domain-containing protein [Pseudomonadota bacterium]